MRLVKAGLFICLILKLGAPQAIVYIDPPIIPQKTIGEECTLKVRIRDAVSVKGWSVGMDFNPSVLNGIGFTMEDSFLKYEGGVTHQVQQIPGTIDNAQGILTPCGSVRMDSTAFGDGSLLKIRFRIVGSGNSQLTLRNVEIMHDPFYSPPVLAINGFYGNENIYPTPSFLISTTIGNNLNSDIAYNVNQNEFLVVWTSGIYEDIHGQRISSTGALIGNNFAISSSGIARERLPAICKGGTNYLVAYEKSSLGNFIRNTNLFGRLIQSDGSVGSEFTINNAIRHQGFADIAWNGTNYLVVWQDSRMYSPTSDSFYPCIYGQLISQNGTLIGTEIFIADSVRAPYYGMQYKAYLPRVATDGTRYFVVWIREQNQVWGRLINPDGTLYPDTVPIFAPSPPGDTIYNINRVDVVWNGSNYLVIWNGSRWQSGGIFSIFGRRISVDGNVLGSVFRIVPESISTSMPRVDWEGSYHRIIFVNNQNPPSIWRQAVSSDGNLYYGPSCEADASYHQIFPALAFGNSHPLIVWSDFRNCQNYNIYGNVPEIIGTEEVRFGIPQTIKIYPNPANKMLYITNLPGYSYAEVFVYDVCGRLVYNSGRISNQNELVWDLQDMGGNAVTDGVYFIYLKHEGNFISKKIIIIRK
ncbi:MAG: T9SS type A sorting domain-containing protein [candidate division WOR-3 bacterium]